METGVEVEEKENTIAISSHLSFIHLIPSLSVVLRKRGKKIRNNKREGKKGKIILMKTTFQTYLLVYYWNQMTNYILRR